jgi:hypothetical protein
MKTLKSLLGNNSFSQKKQYYRTKSSDKESDIFDFLDLIRNWQDIVGPRLVESTIPLKLKNKNLSVLASHPVFAQQLSFMEAMIIKKIEERFPSLERQIKKIYFQADNKHFQQKIKSINEKQDKKEEFEQQWHKHSPEYKKLMASADDLLCEVTDKDLKDSLSSLFIQLSSKKDK